MNSAKTTYKGSIYGEMELVPHQKSIRLKSVLVASFILLAIFVLAKPALAAPGDLDTTFGGDGTVVTRFFDSDGNPLFSPGDDLVIQPDGKVVVAGGDTMARYTPDGSLDPSFDGDGKVVGSGGGGDIAMQSDGKIVVAGQFVGRNSQGQLDFDFQVLRYNPDGSPDSTFDGDGSLTTSVGPGRAFDSAHGVLVQPDGKIVVAGYSHDYGTGNQDLALVRYNADGSLDPSFGGDGKVTTDFGSGQDFATDIALRPDGTMIVAGGSGRTTNEYGVTIDDDFVVASYNPDGSLDTTFDGDGKVTTNFGSGKDAASKIVLQPDGKIAVAGASQHATESNGNTINDFAVARYNPDGTLDATFDGDGKLTTAIGSHNDVATDLLLQDNGKIVAVGKTAVPEDQFRRYKLALVRYNADGSLDPLFDGDGMVSGQGINQQNVAAGLRADGKILVSSTSTNQGQLLTRYYGGDDVTPPGPVTALAGDATTNTSVSLTWNKPTDTDYEVTRVFRSNTGFATSPTPAADQAKVYEGTVTNHTDTGVTLGATYFYTAFTRDTSGNWSSEAKVKVIVDPISPETVIASGPSGPTNDNTPTFVLDGSDNLTAKLDLLYSYKVNDEAWTPYSSATSITLGSSAGLPEGPYTLYARAKDRAGKVDESPAQRSFTVDTVAPEVNITSGPSGTISAGSARFEFSSSEAGATFICKLDSAADFTNCSSPKNYTGLSNGDHTFSVRAVDSAGNIGAIASRTWTIAPKVVSQNVEAGGTLTSDTEGDGATTSDPLETSITSPTGGDVSVTETVALDSAPAQYSFLGQQANITAPASTADNPLKFIFLVDSSIIPSGQDQSTIEVFRNGVKVEACADQSGVASPNPCVLDRSLLADGDIQLTILTSAASHWNFGVLKPDTTAPKGTVKINGGKAYTKSPTVNLSLSATDSGSGISSMRIKNDGSSWSAWMPYATTKSWTLNRTNGTRTVYAQYRDRDGNISTTALDKIKLDTVKSRISGMTPKHRSITRDTTPAIKAVVRDKATNLQKSNIKLYVAGKRVTKFNYSAATDKLTYTSPRLTKGKKVVKIVATDAAGNVSTKNWFFTIK